jgi:hypothetical protein
MVDHDTPAQCQCHFVAPCFQDIIVLRLSPSIRGKMERETSFCLASIVRGSSPFFSSLQQAVRQRADANPCRAPAAERRPLLRSPPSVPARVAPLHCHLFPSLPSSSAATHSSSRRFELCHPLPSSYRIELLHRLLEFLCCWFDVVEAVCVGRVGAASSPPPLVALQILAARREPEVGGRAITFASSVPS